MYYILLTLLLIIVLLMIIGDGISRKVLFSPPRSFEETEKIEKDNGSWDGFDSMNKEELNFILNDGYLIHGSIIWNNPASNKFVIVTHGFRYNRYGSIKYINVFKKCDYNVYIYDLRAHGANERTLIGMGLSESSDLNELIHLFRLKMGKDCVIALHGESLGAFTSLMVLKYKPEIKFVISDCSYSNTIDELKFQMNKRGIPSIIFYLSVIMADLKYNQKWRDLDARKVVANTQIPILFIHGDSDTFTPPYMAKDLYECCSSKCDLVYFDGAEHAQSLISNKEKYNKVISSFIDSLES